MGFLDTELLNLEPEGLPLRYCSYYLLNDIGFCIIFDFGITER